MATDAETGTSSHLSVAFRVALVGAVVAAIAAAYWFASRGAPGEPHAEAGGQLERIVAMTRPADEPPEPAGPEAASAESMASALAAEQPAGGGALAEREFAAIDEVTLDIGDGQQTRLTSGRGGTRAIHELSAVDDGVGPVLGGRIVLVSLTEPSVLVLDNGKRFGPGARMPNGHVVAAIERERIVLERDGVVSVVRLP